MKAHILDFLIIFAALIVLLIYAIRENLPKSHRSSPSTNSQPKTRTQL